MGQCEFGWVCGNVGDDCVIMGAPLSSRPLGGDQSADGTKIVKQWTRKMRQSLLTLSFF